MRGSNMSNENKGYIQALNLVDKWINIPPRYSRILRGSDIIYDPTKKITIGGTQSKKNDR